VVGGLVEELVVDVLHEHPGDEGEDEVWVVIIGGGVVAEARRARRRRQVEEDGGREGL
jgi:hypothetical protein